MNYRLIFCFFIVWLYTKSSSLAQIPEWSIRGGLNLSSTGGIDAENQKIKLGNHIGVFTSLPITSVYRLESGLSYSLKGARSKALTYKYNFHLHYLDLPILARVNIHPGIDIIAGPQLSYLLVSKTRIKNNGKTLIENSTEGLSRMDVSIHLGASYDLQNQLTVGLGFDWGMIPLDKEGNFKTYNRVLKFTVGYHLQ